MTEARAVWVFARDEAEGAAPVDALPATDLASALGVTALDMDFVEQFRADTLSDYGFSAYLTEANGMDADQVAPDAAVLDALTGPVVLVFTAAMPANVVPVAQPPLRLIGRYHETETLRLPEPLMAAAAQGTLDGPARKGPPSEAAMMGRVAMVALLVIFALTALVVWVAS